MSAFEKRYIEDALRRAEGKLTEAARLAGIDHRKSAFMDPIAWDRS